MEILLATANPGKIAAFRRLLRDLPIRILEPTGLGVDLDVSETGSTFVENALIKARAYRDVSGMNSLADDSGLCIDALNGEPGVHSARYGGLAHSPTEQNLLILEQMQGCSNRRARFVSVIAFAGVNGEEWTEEGNAEGEIAMSMLGSQGFGYDPIFIIPELGKTYAELEPSIKDPISHRGRAMAAARSHLCRDVGLLD